MRQVGKGRVIQDTALESVMAADGLPPDFEPRGVTSEIEVDWIHRRTDRMDIYFVAESERGSRAGRGAISNIGQGSGTLGSRHR